MIHLNIDQAKELLSGYQWYSSYWGEIEVEEKILIEYLSKAIEDAEELNEEG